jgi:hypothetical protein
LRKLKKTLFYCRIANKAGFFNSTNSEARIGPFYGLLSKKTPQSNSPAA